MFSFDIRKQNGVTRQTFLEQSLEKRLALSLERLL